MTYRIAIVGAGFCGTVLSAHLLRKAATPITITLIERSPSVGRGVAYAARDWPYMLNVPAARMSADSNAPRQFLEYAQRNVPGVDAEHYLPRELYGDYLQDVLRRAEQEASAAISFERIQGEVTAIGRAPRGPGLELVIAGHTAVAADCVVLALGAPPARELALMKAMAQHPAYHADPWSLPRHLGAERVVMILGNGLSMADAVWSLCDDPSRIPKIVSLSRRGLLPLPQAAHAATPSTVSTARLTDALTIRQLLVASRSLAREHMAHDGDWRDVVTAIRHVAPRLWQRLPFIERQRFVRHLQSYWDVHRHRLPPSMWSRLDTLRRAGQLEVSAGRLVGAQEEGDRLRLVWRSRGSDSVKTLLADAVVNALGPEYQVRHSEDPLLQSLLASGIIREDDLRLGLHTGNEGACVHTSGNAHGVYYLGPMLRAKYWEATAATELRDHAERLAAHLTTIASG